MTGRVLPRGGDDSGGEVVPLTQKAFEVLPTLVEQSGRIVAKEKLIGRVWPDSFVEESNLTQNVYMPRTPRKWICQYRERSGNGSKITPGVQAARLH